MLWVIVRNDLSIKHSKTNLRRLFPDKITYKQVCGSGSGFLLDPDSIRSVDPDPYSESGSGYRRAKMTYKSRKKLRNFML
jgi:hypothetical protein